MAMVRSALRELHESPFDAVLAEREITPEFRAKEAKAVFGDLEITAVIAAYAQDTMTAARCHIAACRAKRVAGADDSAEEGVKAVSRELFDLIKRRKPHPLDALQHFDPDSPDAHVGAVPVESEIVFPPLGLFPIRRLPVETVHFIQSLQVESIEAFQSRSLMAPVRVPKSIRYPFLRVVKAGSDLNLLKTTCAGYYSLEERIQGFLALKSFVDSQVENGFSGRSFELEKHFLDRMRARFFTESTLRTILKLGLFEQIFTHSKDLALVLLTKIKRDTSSLERALNKEVLIHSLQRPLFFPLVKTFLSSDEFARNKEIFFPVLVQKLVDSMIQESRIQETLLRDDTFIGCEDSVLSPLTYLTLFARALPPSQWKLFGDMLAHALREQFPRGIGFPFRSGESRSVAQRRHQLHSDFQQSVFYRESAQLRRWVTTMQSHQYSDCVCTIS